MHILQGKALPVCLAFSNTAGYVRRNRLPPLFLQPWLRFLSITQQFSTPNISICKIHSGSIINMHIHKHPYVVSFDVAKKYVKVIAMISQSLMFMLIEHDDVTATLSFVKFDPQHDSYQFGRIISSTSIQKWSGLLRLLIYDRILEDAPIPPNLIFYFVLLEMITGKQPINRQGVMIPRWVQSVVREEWMA
ncbi:Uncharacterized protein Fot_38535 [Forsythia ovata]|uniref:Uncharacterized protein n=1 Tax=Forsythia ovata TaxID=205694 RepID=A0ABD1S225_9LAMI